MGNQKLKSRGLPSLTFRKNFDVEREGSRIESEDSEVEGENSEDESEESDLQIEKINDEMPEKVVVKVEKEVPADRSNLVANNKWAPIFMDAGIDDFEEDFDAFQKRYMLQKKKLVQQRCMD